MKNKDQSAQYGNRLTCNGKLYSSNGAQIGCVDKASSKRPFSSSRGKEIVGSSSRRSSAIRNTRKSIAEPFGKLSSQLETDSSENGSIHDEMEELELISISSPGMFHKELHVKPESLVSAHTMFMERGSSSTGSNTRSKRTFNQRFVVDNQDIPVSVRSKGLCQSSSAGGSSKYSSRNLVYNSVSDVISSDRSLLDGDLVRRKNVAKKVISDGENSSSTKGKKADCTSSGQNRGANRGLSITDQSQTRNMFHRQNGLASLGTQRLISGRGGVRHSYQGSGNGLPSQDSRVMTSWMPQSNVSISFNSSGSSHFSPESHSRTYHEPERNSQHEVGQATRVEAGITRTFTNLDGFRCHNVDGIAEVLLASERIEQDEELTYEQAILMETSMFLSSLNIYDQHRDMRLNIDNMTYEELLELEERMGTVSTTLSEEALTECLKRSIYQLKPPAGAATSSIEDSSDVKCCICQEEYESGDEVGRLHCEHQYHVKCIRQWMRLKNWCPICKSSAAACSS